MDGGQGSDYILSGLIVCKNCGYSYHGHRRYNSSGTQYRYYEDSGFNLHGDAVCTRTSIPADAIEKFIVNKLDAKISRIIDKDRLRSLVAEKLMSMSCSANTHPSNGHEYQLEEVERKLTNLTAALENGADFAPIIARMKALEKKKQQLELALGSASYSIKKPIDVDQAVGEIVNLADSALATVRDSSPQQAKQALRHFVNRVEVDPLKKIATFFVYKIPRTSPTYNSVVPVYSCRRPDSNRHAPFRSKGF